MMTEKRDLGELLERFRDITVVRFRPVRSHMALKVH
jgi:hypothetical protein